MYSFRQVLPWEATHHPEPEIRYQTPHSSAYSTMHRLPSTRAFNPRSRLNVGKFFSEVADRDKASPVVESHAVRAAPRASLFCQFPHFITRLPSGITCTCRWQSAFVKWIIVPNCGYIEGRGGGLRNAARSNGAHTRSDICGGVDSRLGHNCVNELFCNDYPHGTPPTRMIAGDNERKRQFFRDPIRRYESAMLSESRSWLENGVGVSARSRVIVKQWTNCCGNGHVSAPKGRPTVGI